MKNCQYEKLLEIMKKLKIVAKLVLTGGIALMLGLLEN